MTGQLLIKHFSNLHLSTVQFNEQNKTIESLVRVLFPFTCQRSWRVIHLHLSGLCRPTFCLPFAVFYFKIEFRQIYKVKQSLSTWSSIRVSPFKQHSEMIINFVCYQKKRGFFRWSVWFNFDSNKNKRFRYTNHCRAGKFCVCKYQIWHLKRRNVC